MLTPTLGRFALSRSFEHSPCRYLSGSIIQNRFADSHDNFSPYQPEVARKRTAIPISLAAALPILVSNVASFKLEFLREKSWARQSERDRCREILLPPPISD